MGENETTTFRHYPWISRLGEASYEHGRTFERASACSRLEKLRV